MTFSLADLSPSSNVAVAHDHAVLAQTYLTQGDQATNDTTAIDAYRRSSGQSEIAALTSQTVTEAIAGSNPAAAGFDAATKSVAQSATASVSDAGRTTDRAAAHAAAVAGLQAANIAIGYATQATALPRPTSYVTIGLVGLSVVVGSAILVHVLRKHAAETTRMRSRAI
jgi:hypothetical protein